MRKSYRYGNNSVNNIQDIDQDTPDTMANKTNIANAKALSLIAGNVFSVIINELVSGDSTI